MNNTWVLVADKGHARFFSVDGPTSPLIEEDDLIHQQSRMREQELISDSPGKSSGVAGMGRHPMTKENEARNQEAIHFAREISDKLADAQQQGLRKLYVVSDPGFLGTLRRKMPGQLRRLVTAEIDKNLAGLATDEIRQHLPRYL